MIGGRLSAAVFAAVAAAVGLVAVLGGRAAERPASQRVSYVATPFPQPTPDPAARAPAYLASVDAWLVALDASGRVARVGPAREAGAALCPGGRRIVVAESWRGRVEVFSIGLRRLSAQPRCPRDPPARGAHAGARRACTGPRQPPAQALPGLIRTDRCGGGPPRFRFAQATLGRTVVTVQLPAAPAAGDRPRTTGYHGRDGIETLLRGLVRRQS